MIHLISILTVVILIQAFETDNNATPLQNTLPCPLKWSQFSRGNPLPEQFIPVDFNSNPASALKEGVPIARQKIFGNYTVGSVDTELVAHFVHKQAFNLWNYDVLTNPFSCTIQFLPEGNSSIKQFGVNIATNSGFLGRVYNDRHNLWYPCTIKEGFCHFVDTDDEMQQSKVFQRLVSYSPGLTMNLRNLSFTIDKDIRTIETMGVDIIRNKGDATIRKSLVHTKTTVKTLNWNFGFTFRLQIGLSLNIMKNWLMPRAPDLAGYLAFGQTHTWRQGRITEDVVTLTKDVDIPARTSVECISAIVMREVYVNVRTEVEFSAIGHSGEEVATLLRNSGEEGPFSLEGNKVVLQTNASFHGTAPFSNEFLVLPYNALTGSTGKTAMADLRNKFKKADGVQGFHEGDFSKFINAKLK